MGLAGPTNQKRPTDHPVQLSQQAVDIAWLTMPLPAGSVMNPVLDQFIRSDFPYPAMTLLPTAAPRRRQQLRRSISRREKHQQLASEPLKGISDVVLVQ